MHTCRQMTAKTKNTDLVLSEIHLERVSHLDTSRFHYRASQSCEEASDSSSGYEEARSSGEAAAHCARVRRRPGRRRHVALRHSAATPLGRCGEQVWRGACALADVVLSGGAGRRVLELGAGCGLVAALAAAELRCDLFVATDREPSALRLAAANVAEAQKSRARRHGSSSRTDGGTGDDSDGTSALPPEVLVRRLDFFSFLGVDAAQLTADELLLLLNGRVIGGDGSGSSTATAAAAAEAADAAGAPAGEFGWARADLAALASVDTLLAGDVVYDPPLTEAFAHAAACLMRWIAAHGRRQERQQEQTQEQQQAEGEEEQKQQQQQGKYGEQQQEEEKQQPTTGPDERSEEPASTGGGGSGAKALIARLCAFEYETKTRGVRHQPPARMLAEAAYVIGRGGKR